MRLTESRCAVRLPLSGVGGWVEGVSAWALVFVDSVWWGEFGDTVGGEFDFAFAEVDLGVVVGAE